ncbi:hypothetical protein WIW50_11555 [Flavobacteriaceae bacterium 3-367]
MKQVKRNNFKSQTKEALARRSGFQCSICKALTIGPSTESELSVTNIGVAAHITAASPGGPRFDASIAAESRSGISNGIWLCQNHAALIDRDILEWTVAKLRDVKFDHEKFISERIGIPVESSFPELKFLTDSNPPIIAIQEYAFLKVGLFDLTYRNVIAPILNDKGLTDDFELGILMCSSGNEDSLDNGHGVPWTVFVNATWLKWYLNGQTAGYKIAREVPKEQIYGRIPAWPDNFYEFLSAIVRSNSTFKWKRHSNDYLVLTQ